MTNGTVKEQRKVKKKIEMSVTNRLLITKSLVNFTRNLRPVQRNLSAVRFTRQKQRNYVKYMLVVGGGVTAFMFANFMKTKSNRHEALNLKRMKVRPIGVVINA